MLLFELTWIEAAFVLSPTSTATTEILRSSFGHFGLLSTVVFNNTPYLCHGMHAPKACVPWHK